MGIAIQPGKGAVRAGALGQGFRQHRGAFPDPAGIGGDPGDPALYPQKLRLPFLVCGKNILQLPAEGFLNFISFHRFSSAGYSAVLSASSIMARKEVCRSSELVASPVTRLSLMVQMASAFL